MLLAGHGWPIRCRHGRAGPSSRSSAPPGRAGSLRPVGLADPRMAPSPRVGLPTVGAVGCTYTPSSIRTGCDAGVRTRRSTLRRRRTRRGLGASPRSLVGSAVPAALREGRCGRAGDGPGLRRRFHKTSCERVARRGNAKELAPARQPPTGRVRPRKRLAFASGAMRKTHALNWSVLRSK
jgi:hypothetical protein